MKPTNINQLKTYSPTYHNPPSITSYSSSPTSSNEYSSDTSLDEKSHSLLSFSNTTSLSLLGIVVIIGIGGIIFLLTRNRDWFLGSSRGHTLLRGGSDHGDDDDSFTPNTDHDHIVFDDFISSKKSSSFFNTIGKTQSTSSKKKSKYELAPGIEIGPMHKQYRDEDDDILEITL